MLNANDSSSSSGKLQLFINVYDPIKATMTIQQFSMPNYLFISIAKLNSSF